MTPRAYNGIKNIPYTPGRKIGQGGEGTVFEVQENFSLVVKIYNEALSTDKTEKLLYMASIANDELTRFAAWPLDVVRDHNMKVCGFIMKKLVGFVPMHSLFSPMERKKLFPDRGYNFLVHVARNLATAFHKIHELGIVIGDVNEANILVNTNGLISLIDCDSFQVKNGSRYHFCEVGIPRYTPPELLERGSFTNVIRTENTDSFSLATLIFQLLFLGRAPFTGINLSREDFDEEKAIKAREFAYSLQHNNKKLLPAKNSLELKSLTPAVINDFHAAFEGTGIRPTPRQWAADLDELGKQMIMCPHSKIHFYPRTMRACPWCQFEHKTGIFYFLDDSHLKSIPELNNLEQFINGFKLDRLEIKKLTENYAVGNLRPNPINNKLTATRKLNRSIFFSILALTILAFMLDGWEYGAVGLIFMFVFYLLSPMKKELNKELAERKKKFDSLLTQLRAVIKKHNNSTEFKKYNQSSAQLVDYISAYRNLPQTFAANKKKIEEKYYNAQYYLYLQPFDILHETIPNFGPAKKKLIYNKGIKNAADIGKLNTTKISGIGPKNIQVLFDWQRQIGSGFTYVPDFTAINKDISAAINEIAVKRRRLEIDITHEYRNVGTLQAKVNVTSQGLQRQYTDLALKVYQADLDLKAFQKFNNGII
jgi:DNA-binding helix-hairpin-helix protein with protein kinase domain